ncbi:hypothetical protein ACHAXM_010065 [Skeletonema potamos]|jgi:hypothetical protein
MEGDDPPYNFTEVKPSRWNKNRNKSSSLTPIPTYTPTTPWPTYSPTTEEDRAEWLKKKQKYLKNRDKIPDSVWESDEASVGKKKQIWLEKQKEKKKESDNEGSNKEEAASSVKKDTNEEEGTSPTPKPTFYDPPVVPTRKQTQLEKREKLAAAQKQNTTNYDAIESSTPSLAPTVLVDSFNNTDSPSSSNIPTISNIPTVKVVQGIPTKRLQQKQAKEQAKLVADNLNNSTATADAAKTQEPSGSPGMSSRYRGSRAPPKSREPPGSRSPPPEESSETTEDAALDGATEESEPEVLESLEESEPANTLETNKKSEKNNDDKIVTSDITSKKNDKATPSSTPSGKQSSKTSSTSEKVSLILNPEELERPPATRDAPKVTPKPTPTPTPAPVKKTTTVKVNLTFTNNRAKKNVTPAPTPAVTSGEPTYLLFPTIVPTDPHPTYAPTDAWSWTPTVNKDRKKSTDKPSLFDKRTCPSDNIFIGSELHMAEGNGGSVFFTYGIQTGKDGDIEDAVEKIQLWLLEDVASRLLHCSKNSFAMRSNENGGVLSSVYYSKDDRQYAKECNPTTSKANMCAIVSSTLRFDAVDQEVHAQSKVLAVIFNQIQSGYDARLEEANILDLVYLGPELGYQQQDDVEVKDTSTSSSSSPTIMYASIGVASVAVFALLLCIAMSYKLRKERRRKMPPGTSSYCDNTASNYRDTHHDDTYSYTPTGSRRSYYR